MFDWIKRSVKNAILAGVNEAIAELSGATGPQIASPKEVILCLPAPADSDDDAQPTKKVTRRTTA